MEDEMERMPEPEDAEGPWNTVFWAWRGYYSHELMAQDHKFKPAKIPA